MVAAAVAADVVRRTPRASNAAEGGGTWRWAVRESRSLHQ